MPIQQNGIQATLFFVETFLYGDKYREEDFQQC